MKQKDDPATRWASRSNEVSNEVRVVENIEGEKESICKTENGREMLDGEITHLIL